ncbi:hypothetical protein [Roseiflexus sp.]|uniref:hypothetical protein n=1 Tax=Roseiflexus sp. TaxID=2562120 RepID=UPI00398A5500
MSLLQYLLNIRARLTHFVTLQRTTLPAQLYEVAFGAAPAADTTEAPPTTRLGGYRRTAIVTAVTAGLFYTGLIYFASRHWDPLTLRNVQFDIRGVIIACLFQFAGYLWNLHVWQMLFIRSGYRLRFLLHLKIYVYSSLAVKIPGFFWGIATRVVLYQRQGVPFFVVGAISLLETVLFAISSGVILFIMVDYWPEEYRFIYFPALFSIIIILFVIGLNRKFFVRFFLRINSDFFSKLLDRLSWKNMPAVMLFYIVTLVSGGISLFAVICSVVGYNPNFFSVAMYAWALSVLWAALLSWLPFDFGLRQGPLLIVLSTVFPPPVVVVITIVWRVWFNACELLWGIIAFGVAVRLDRKRISVSDSPGIIDKTPTTSIQDVP